MQAWRRLNEASGAADGSGLRKQTEDSECDKPVDYAANRLERSGSPGAKTESIEKELSPSSAVWPKRISGVGFR
jgi:hypothetical protein